MTVLIRQQVFIIKKEIEVLMKQIRCSSCGKLLCIQGTDGTIVIRCPRCKTDTAIKA
jgi:predicted Zn-ribbon and HTH transcriptional regulator